MNLSGKFLELTKAQQNLTVSKICVLMGGIACLFYAIPRLGTTDLSGLTDEILLKVFLLGAFIQLFPNLIKQGLQKFYPGKNFTEQSDAGWLMGTILALALIPLLPVDTHLLQAAWLLPAFGVLAHAIGRGLIVNRKNPFTSVFWLLPAVAFMLWVLSRYYQFRSPFFFERLASGSSAIDSLFHISLANMLHVQHLISNGLDGAPFSPYHFGSHWFFGQLSTWLGIKPIQFYLVGFPIIILPLFFKALMTFVIDLLHFFMKREGFPVLAQKYAALFLWGPLVLGFISFVPPGIEKGLALNYFDILLSESYTTAFTWTFLTLSLLLPLFSGENKKFLWIVCIPACMAICGLLKVSQMFLAVVCFSYLFLRLQLFRNLWAVASFGLTIILGYWAYGLVNLLAAPVPYHWFDFLRVYIKPNLLPLFFILFYLWTWLFILYELASRKINSMARLKESLFKGELLLSEVLILLSIVGFIPGNVYAIDGMSAIFFAEIQKWIAICLLMASCLNVSALVEERLIPWLQSRRFLQGWPFRLSALALVVGCIVVFLQNYFLPLSKLTTSNARYRRLLQQENMTGKTGATRRMFSQLYSLSDESETFKRKTLLYIPKSNQLFWQMQGCQSIAFLGPSLSGMVMLNALPERSCFRKMPYYGYENYQFTPESSILPDVSQEQLCKKARQLGFPQVLALNGKDTHVVRERHPIFRKKMIIESRGEIEKKLIQCPAN